MAGFVDRVRGRLERRVFSHEQATAYELVAASTMLDPRRLASLWDQVQTCDREGVPGALVECGVWKGGAVAWMGAASRRNRELHLFDAFDDICEPDPAVDGVRAMREARELAGVEATGQLKPLAGIYDAKGGHGTVDACRAVLDRVGYPSGLVTFHVGWFQETMPGIEIGPIAVLRIDGDWYASTMTCLEHLYDQVAPGGFVVIDDYFAYEGCRTAVDNFRAARGIDVELAVIDPATAVAWRA